MSKKCLIPDLKQIKSVSDVDGNCYFLFSSFGYPSILDDIPNAVVDMNEYGYDFLIIVIDSDEATIEERRAEVINKMKDISIDHNKVAVVVQNHCIETWFLGNRKIYSRQPNTPEFMDCSKHYCVMDNDPENMTMDDKLSSQYTTTAQYHEYYLKKMLNERNVKYSKGKMSKAVQDEQYLEQIVHRVENTDHLKSFRYFLEVLNLIKTLMNQQQVATSIE